MSEEIYVQEVSRIKQVKNDFYKVLEVQKESTEDIIKKNYLKKARLVHPDKNKTTGADEAFKILQQAYSCLSDESKRRYYDQFGHESPQAAAAAAGSSARFSTYDDPEEIINAFFGNAFGGGQFYSRDFRNGRATFTSYTRPRARRTTNETQTIDLSSICYLFLIPLLLILLSILSPNLNQKPEFVFERTGAYPNRRITTNLEIQYFVMNDFDSKYTTNEEIEDFEVRVEQSKLQLLSTQCANEQRYKQQLLNQASWAFSKQQREQLTTQANNFKMNSCNLLQKLHKKMQTF
eukprot:TRINITY_DN686_c1_g1_i1.p1 TRINITY_DN686_c1_g1~~TRINITY_DN686_c1_g1_i1.p1  ORF type:complete len:292 (-),score=140.46 TRINITY_DN686_c1_g1_i1:146-1021(-)